MIRLKEGPLFGALIIGFGVGFLYGQKTGDIPKAVLLGLGVGVADYFVLILLHKFKPKK